jgi:hypothetical protein
MRVFAFTKMTDVTGNRARWRNQRITTAAFASLLLHSLIFVPLLFGGHASHRITPPAQMGAAASAEDTSTMISALFMNDDAASLSRLVQTSVSEENFLHAVSSSDLLAALSMPTGAALQIGEPDENAPSKRADNEAAGDEAGRAIMFGRYLGQISARVSRAWLRPRSPINGSLSFECRVQIAQDRSGRVQEVTLMQCTADERWQLSLVHAIESASPLPAPPDLKLFASMVTLEFDSPPYSASANPDDFEPEVVTTVADNRPAAPVDNHVLDTLRTVASGGAGVVHLKIVGSQASVKQSGPSPAPAKSPTDSQPDPTP